jgi:Tfp pilus assembly protein PilF
MYWQFECFAWLLRHNGGFAQFRDTRLIQPTNHFFPQQDLEGHELAKAIFEQVKEYAGMGEWPCRLKAQSEDAKTILAPLLFIADYQSPHGTYRYEPKKGAIITYNPADLHQPMQMIATMAHELGHYLTAYFPEEPPTGWDNWEPATDITGVFLGFGIFIANTRFSFTRFTDFDSHGWSIHSSGYLPEIEILYAQAIFSNLLGIPHRDILPHLKSSLRGEYKKAYREVAAQTEMLALLRAIPASTEISETDFPAYQNLELERIDSYYQRALTAAPHDVATLGQYAMFLDARREDHAKADSFYLQALALDPGNADILGIYALFLETQIQKAEEYYYLALQADPEHAYNLKNYALFLERKRHDYGKANAVYQQAVRTNPKDVVVTGNYAFFLATKVHDFVQAEEVYQQALGFNPDCAELSLRYACMLFLAGRDKEARKQIQNTQLIAGIEPTLELELLFYLAAHVREAWPRVLRQIKKLLQQGVRTPDGPLEASLECAEAGDHPNPALLHALTDVLVQSSDIATLSTFPEWERI